MVLLGFRQLLEGIHALTEALVSLDKTQRRLGPAIDRLEALERSRIHFEADCEGMLLKADGKLKAAASAEQRERQLKKANDRHADPFNPDGDQAPEDAPVPPHDVAGGETPGVPPVRLVLATNDKTHAVRTKWGI